MTANEWKQVTHFTTQEKWGNPKEMDFRLVWLLDRLRSEIGIPFVIHCGFELDGHAQHSFHKIGMAVDFHVQRMGIYSMFQSMSGEKMPLWKYIHEAWWFGGMGIYPYWESPGFHLDLGQYRRWKRGADGKYSNLSKDIALGEMSSGGKVVKLFQNGES